MVAVEEAAGDRHQPALRLQAARQEKKAAGHGAQDARITRGMDGWMGRVKKLRWLTWSLVWR